MTCSVGDVVIRSHRLLKTHGTVVRVASERRGEARLVWVKWDHPDTLPNPSLEVAHDLELVTPRDGIARRPPVTSGARRAPRLDSEAGP